MFAQFRRVFADLWRSDQQLERSAEPAAPAGDNEIAHPMLLRVHLRRADFAIPGHVSSHAGRGYTELIAVKAACHVADPILARSARASLPSGSSAGNLSDRRTHCLNSRTTLAVRIAREGAVLRHSASDWARRSPFHRLFGPKISETPHPKREPPHPRR